MCREVTIRITHIVHLPHGYNWGNEKRGSKWIAPRYGTRIGVRMRSKHIPAFTVEQRELFWSNVEKHSSGCWEWTGLLQGAGYGYWYMKGTYHAHRVAYAEQCGDLVPGYHIHHICENKKCVNPAHLQQLPPKEHAACHSNWNGTHCQVGHDLAVVGTWYLPSSRQFKCKACCAVWQRRRTALLAEIRREMPVRSKRLRMTRRQLDLADPLASLVRIAWGIELYPDIEIMTPPIRNQKRA